MQNELITQLKKSLEETMEYPDTLQNGGLPLHKSYKLEKFLESLFGKGSVIVAYDYDTESSFDDGCWDMSGCDSLFITVTGKVVEVNNSEWGHMGIVGKIKREKYENSEV